MAMISDCDYCPHTHIGMVNQLPGIMFCTRYGNEMEPVGSTGLRNRCVADGPDLLMVLSKLHYWAQR